MKLKLVNIFWGIVMVAAGVIFMLREFGYIDFELLTDTTWAIIFGVMGLFFLITYFMKGIQNWGWLFPGLIFGSIALIIGIADTNLGDMLTGAPVLLSIAIPFIVAFFLNPQKNVWLLIPAWVMTILTIVVLFADFIDGNLIGTMILWGIGLPFLLIYFMDKNRKWALIPFLAMMVVGTFPLLDTILHGWNLDIAILLLLALPFYIVYFWNRKNWWALIPAGVFTSIVLSLLVDLIPLSGKFLGAGELQASVILAGFGLTFGGLWLMRSEHQTGWAIYPALALLGVALLVSFFSNISNLIGAFLLIAAGAGIVIYSQLKKPKTE